jgi:hypothetical protein
LGSNLGHGGKVRDTTALPQKAEVHPPHLCSAAKASL